MLHAPQSLQNRQNAQSLLMMLRGSAIQDAAGSGAPESLAEAPATLLEQLRASSAASPPPREGLLAMLSQPAVWDLPLAPRRPVEPPQLVGRPIEPAAGGLMGLLPEAFGAPPPSAGQPFWSAARPPAPSAPPAGPAAPPAGAMRASLAPASLAEVFRVVSAPSAPPPAAPPQQTDSLKDILRGLRSGRGG
ncbi:hypothetical protein [Roseomonas marmotae]|uniref:Uncharacterized protein n=1 Tax=Roseomonas marmotae TaxID=2768161 RepID=A0ABS3KH10_9PROT|nr:hypothetical protein [Roseomonas marmotae]MBO1075621.1 hypothetical protein [Roseomonas marmotae]QTI79483.1 hypothetical protein IAI58_01255 [Roseomonas marmotae]